MAYTHYCLNCPILHHGFPALPTDLLAHVALRSGKANCHSSHANSHPLPFSTGSGKQQHLRQQLLHGEANINQHNIVHHIFTSSGDDIRTLQRTHTQNAESHRHSWSNRRVKLTLGLIVDIATDHLNMRMFPIARFFPSL